MIDLLVTLIIFAVVGGLIYWLILQLPLPEPFLTFVRIGVILIFVLLLLGVLFGGVALPWHNGALWRR